MILHSHFAAALLVVSSVGGAVACSHDQPRADEALIILPGTTSGGAGMGGVEPASPQARYGTRSLSLGTIDAPSAGGAVGGSAPAGGPGTTVTVTTSQTPSRATNTVSSGYPGAPMNNGAAPSTVGTVNGDYGPLPSSGDAVPTANYGTPGGVITH